MYFRYNIFKFLLIFCEIIICSAQYNDRYIENRNYGHQEEIVPIPIGLITDQNTYELSRVFDHAIEVANAEPSIQLFAKKDEVNYGDCFEGYEKLCQMLETSVAGIFGPSSKHTAEHLMTVCEYKDIPYFYPFLSKNLLSFNLSPHPTDLALALYSLLAAYEWTRFVFLYESVEYLNILHELVSYYENNTPVITVLRYDPELNGNYKPILRRVGKSTDNYIVVVGSTDTMQEFLKQAQQVGIINESYNYIIANLDFHTFDLEEYKYSEANITSFRMYSPEQPNMQTLLNSFGFTDVEEIFRNGSCPITMEMALTFDAVQLFAETLKHHSLRPVEVSCSKDSDNVLDDGSSFRNYMRSMDIQNKTLTGRIFFEGYVRKGYTFDIIELQPSGIVKVGGWNENDGFIAQRLAPTKSQFDNVDNSLADKTFIVLLSVHNKPYASIVESHHKLEGNNQYEGYGVDLIKELAGKLGFNFTFIDGGNDYGTFNKSTNASTGMLKAIMEGKADLAVTDLTITSEREEAIDFSIPFMSLGIAILYIKPQTAPPELFSFMDPFSEEVWWFLGLTYFGVSLSFFILGRLSPAEWDNPFPCVEEPTELENQFTIGNSLWFTTGALLQQGSEIAPKAWSTRLVASIWWFFTLIIVSSYTANLAAFLTLENPTSLIDNVEDLADNKGGVNFGAKRLGSTRNFFLTSEDPVYKKMNDFMTDHPEFLTETNQEGVDRVKSGSYYAFLMESTSIEFNTMRECNLRKLGDALDEKGYGIAMRKNWPYRDKFNNALLELQEQGVLAKMKNKWWNEVGAGLCSSKEDAPEASELNMENLGGVYFVLVVGSTLAIIYGVISWLLYVISKAHVYHVPLKDAFIEEFKIVTDLQTYTREMKSAASVYSLSKSSSRSSAVSNKALQTRWKFKT